MTAVRWLIAGVILVGAACGDSGFLDRDAAPPPSVPPCLLRGDLDDPPSDFAGCGVCIEPQARLPFPTVLDLAGDIHLAAVPEGVIVTFAGAFVTFVSVDGDVHRLATVPGDVIWPDGFLGLDSYAVPVPDRAWVWIVRTFSRIPGPMIEQEFVGVASLYEYGGGTWNEIASGDTAGLFSGVALPDGSLVAVGLDAPSVNPRLTRLQAATSQEIDILERPVSEVGGGRVEYLWRVDNDLVAVLVLTGASPHDSHIAQIDEELTIVGEPQAVTPRRSDPIYDSGDSPYVFAYELRPEGELAMLLQGTIRGIDAAPQAHLWVNRVSTAGTLLRAPPGSWVNPEDFLRIGELAPGETRAAHPALDVLPGGCDGVVWYDGTPERVHHAQTLDETGSLLFEGNTIHPVDLANSTSPRVHDGQSNAYVAGPSRIDRDYTLLWTASVHACAGIADTGNSAFAGAYDEGVWLAWIDTQYDNQGVPAAIVKITLIRPDGTFAWSD